MAVKVFSVGQPVEVSGVGRSTWVAAVFRRTITTYKGKRRYVVDDGHTERSVPAGRIRAAKQGDK